MKKHFLFLLLLSTFFHQLGTAQVQKGMHTFDFSYSYNLPNFDNVDDLDLPTITLSMGTIAASTSFNKSSFQLSLGYDRMISNKWMIGAAFHARKNNLFEGFANYYTGVDSTTNPNQEREVQWQGRTESNFEYAFAPRLRYYFINNKLAAFALLETSFGRGKCKQLQRVPPTDWGELPSYEGSQYGFCFNSMGGVGANYFLNSNIALEATFATSIWNNSELIKRTFLANLGINVFLQDFKTYTKDAMAESILKKGNMSLDIINQFTRNINEKFSGNLAYDISRKDFNFTPSLRYFFTDHLEADISLSRSKIDNYLSYRSFNLFQFAINSSYYLKAVNSVYIKPTIGINMDRFRFSNGSASKYWSIPSSLSVNYFSANKKYTVGTSYTYQMNDNRSNDWEVFTGLDYFLTEKLSINSELQFSIRERPDKESISYYASNKRLNFEMGIGFWW